MSWKRYYSSKRNIRLIISMLSSFFLTCFMFSFVIQGLVMMKIKKFPSDFLSFFLFIYCFFFVAWGVR